MTDSPRTIAVYTRTVDVSEEDRGAALTIELDDGLDDGLTFVRLQSYDESKRHTLLGPLRNKRLKVTVEVVDD